MNKLLFSIAVIAMSFLAVQCNNSSEDKDQDPPKDTTGTTKDTTAQQQDTTQKGDWAAWVNTMPGTGKPTLHVSGAIMAGPEKVRYELARVEPQGINPKILILEVRPAPTNGTNRIDLRFEEEVRSKDQFTSIEIRLGAKGSVMIDKIEEAQ
jgi:hypothetical protein